MVVIDWLQTSEFIRANSERFVLYSLCGCFFGITIILLMISIVLYIEKRQKDNDELSKITDDYQIPTNDVDYNDIRSGTRSYIPIYRYDGRTANGLCNV